MSSSPNNHSDGPPSPHKLLRQRSESKRMEARVSDLHQTFRSGKTRSYDYRIAQLKELQRFLTEQEREIVACLKFDHGRHFVEALTGEIIAVQLFLNKAIAELDEWMAPVHVQTPVEYWFGNSWYEFEPKGVALVIAPWNYPICLLLDGLITAIASGNCCVLKPTEVAAQSSSFLLRVLPEYVDPEAVLVFEGDASFTQALLQYNRFDHILFTGSEAVARKVVSNSNVCSNLTPVTLELGGKNPAIFLHDALFDGDVYCSATAGSKNNKTKNDDKFKALLRRMLKQKLQNCGQVCMAPDYVLLPKILLEDFVACVTDIVQNEFFAKDLKMLNKSGLDTSLSYGRVINADHQKRLQKMLETTTGKVIDLSQRRTPSEKTDNPLSQELSSAKENKNSKNSSKENSQATLSSFGGGGEQPFQVSSASSVASTSATTVQLHPNTSASGAATTASSSKASTEVAASASARSTSASKVAIVIPTTTAEEIVTAGGTPPASNNTSSTTSPALLYHPTCCYFPFHLVIGPSMEDPILKDEIFGPLLPVILYDDDFSADQALETERNSVETASDRLERLSAEIAGLIHQIHDSPLNTYVFGYDEALISAVKQMHQSGAMMQNAPLFYFGHENLPFGGIRRSGCGRVHGRFGFEELSYKRSFFRYRQVLPKQLELLPPIQPPFDTGFLKKLAPVLLKTVRYLAPVRAWWTRWVLRGAFADLQELGLAAFNGGSWSSGLTGAAPSNRMRVFTVFLLKLLLSWYLVERVLRVLRGLKTGRQILGAIRYYFAAGQHLRSLK
ncbi:unnamed protein product [Amoebophrya sp. A120]|nr:unnamed protein product [Amoebophrya sp. A120]|eukprot:GSA120T00011248001.1